MSKKSQKVRFVDIILGVCCAARSTVRNTTENTNFVEYSAKLNHALESGAQALLTRLGFKPVDMAATGSSTRGDFSSDVYGTNYAHPNGSSVSVWTSFTFSPATFNLRFRGTEEQAKAFMDEPHMKD
jgi:hypothetical protein